MKKEKMEMFIYFLIIVFITGYIMRIFYKKSRHKLNSGLLTLDKKENFTHINYDPTDKKIYQLNGDKYADYNYVHKSINKKDDKIIDEIIEEEENFKEKILDQDYIKENTYFTEWPAYKGLEKIYLKDYSENIKKAVRIPNKKINEYMKENDKVCNKNRYNDYGELFIDNKKRIKCEESMNSCNNSKIDELELNKFDRDYFNLSDTKYCKSKLPNNILHDKDTFFNNNRGKTIRQVYDKLVENDYNKDVKKPIDTKKLVVGDNNCKTFTKDMWCYKNEKSNNGGKILGNLYANDPYSNNNLAIF